MGATKGTLDNFTLNLREGVGAARDHRRLRLAWMWTPTPMPGGWGNAEAQAYAEALSALGGGGKTEDISGVASFLASDDAGWVTGRVVDAAGGAGL